MTSFRLARARRLTDEVHPLWLHVVIGEAALRLAVGTEAVRRAQLRHLVDMAQIPNVTVQIVRPEDGFHSAHNGQFVVLDFEQARSVGYSELHDGAVYLQDPEPVRSYQLAAEELQRVALGPEQSLALLRTMLMG